MKSSIVRGAINTLLKKNKSSAASSSIICSRYYSEEVSAKPQFKVSPSQAARNRFIEYRANNLENYMGMVNFVPDVAHIGQRKVRNQVIPKDAPAQLSELGLDLYTRVTPILSFIKSVAWDNMCSHDVEFVDEWESSVKQYERDSSKYTAEDKKILDPIMQRSTLLWNVALHAENLSSILATLGMKYRNTYTYPDEDKDVILDITAEYVELRDKYWEDREIRDKLADSIFQRLTLLKQKIVLPEIMIKFPKLFV